MDSSRGSFRRYWLPVYVWMAAIFAVSSLPRDYLSKLPFLRFSNLAHFCEYVVLGILLIRAFLHSEFNFSVRRFMVLAIFIASLYALTDEVHQYFVPGREMDAKDWTIDLLGSSIGIVVYRIFKVAAKSFARPAS